MIRSYSQKEIESVFLAGKILAKVFKALKKEVMVGVPLGYLDRLAYQITKRNGAEPAFLGYQPNGAQRPFGASICASVNEVIVHGFPSGYKLRDGDILKIDFGVRYKNFFADAAVTLGIGNISNEAKHLIKITELALKKAVEKAKAGNTLGDIGWIIQKTAGKNKLKVIRDLTGHGIGLNLHEDPTIYNYGERKKGLELKPGMILAIEPMFATGSEKIVQRPDESWATADGSLSAHFEHTVAITEKESKIITKGTS